MPASFRISCDDCVRQGTPTCEDCVVTFVCRRDPEDAVVIDMTEAGQLRFLADQGLLPQLRHRRCGS